MKKNVQLSFDETISSQTGKISSQTGKISSQTGKIFFTSGLVPLKAELNLTDEHFQEYTGIYV